MPRLRFKKATPDDLTEVVTAAKVRMNARYTAINAVTPLVPYTTGGAESAETTVTTPAAAGGVAPIQVPYRTYENMHAEMRALGANLPPWTLTPAGQVQNGAGVAVPVANYSTDVPHCGYCTIMLNVLGLPFSTPAAVTAAALAAGMAPGAAAAAGVGVGPTKGMFNLANNLVYPLPDQVKNNLAVLRLLYGGPVAPGLVAIKQVLNKFVGNPSPTWVLHVPGPPARWVSDAAILMAAPGGGELIVPIGDLLSHRVEARNDTKFGEDTGRNMLWKVIWQALYEITKG